MKSINDLEYFNQNIPELTFDEYDIICEKMVPLLDPIIVSVDEKALVSLCKDGYLIPFFIVLVFVLEKGIVSNETKKILTRYINNGIYMCEERDPKQEAKRICFVDYVMIRKYSQNIHCDIPKTINRDLMTMLRIFPLYSAGFLTAMIEDIRSDPQKEYSVAYTDKIRALVGTWYKIEDPDGKIPVNIKDIENVKEKVDDSYFSDWKWPSVDQIKKHIEPNLHDCIPFVFFMGLFSKQLNLFDLNPETEKYVHELIRKRFRIIQKNELIW